MAGIVEIVPIQRLATLVCLFAAAVPAMLGDNASDQAVLRLLTDPATGTPIPASRLDRARALEIYRIDGGAKALGHILTEEQFADLNMKLGSLRAELIRECWAEVVKETGVVLEINNAGKNNGALSDVDLFFFTEALRSLANPKIDADSIHGHVLERFLFHWNRRAGGVPPSALDIALIRGDSFLVDWRMSKLRPGQFAVRQAMQIARLSATEGAYWVPGGYKQQVYVRYLAEGKLLRISRSMKDPDGVVFQEGSTRELSKLYENARVDWDRSANLENILQNFQQAEENPKLVKKSKYTGRFTDPRPLTNLEVDFRFLNLRGQNHLIAYHLQRLFERGVPPELGTILDVVELADRIDLIELDKIIRAMGSGERPKWWSEKWRKHQTHNYESPEDKDKIYLARESRAVVAAARAAGRDLSGDAHLAERVRLAEELFNRKVMALGRHLARDAAIELFREVFTREGFARHRAVYGAASAHRRVIERSLGLRSILVFIDDPEMIRTVLEAAPPELRPIIRLIAEIPEAQRKLIRERDYLTEDDLRQVIPLIDDLRARLGIDDTPPGERAELPDGYGSLRRAESLYQRVLRRLPQGIDPDQMPAFLRLAQVPSSPAVWLNQIHERAFDIGTVDTTLRIFTSYATGDTRLALKQFEEGVAGIVFGPAWNLAEAYRDSRDTGSNWPFLKFAGVSAAPALGIGGPVGVAVAGWGIYNSLYQLAWHFYLEPIQNVAVSYVLMGDDTAVRKGVTATSAAPGDPARLRQAAILFRHVPLPELTNTDRAAISRALFWADANRETMQALPPGTVRADPNWNWRDAAARHRDGLLAGYARASDYWLRRIWFYSRVTVPFSRWVQSVTADPDWQRISDTPPLFMRDWSDSARQESFPDAFRRTVEGRILWDHERIWLRRYFNNWIDEYQAQWRRRDDEQALFRYLRSASPDWEKAVVNELIAYYLEGELQDLKSRDAETANRLKEQTKAAVDAVGREVARSTAAAAAAANAASERIEQLYWHPALADRLGLAMMDAAERQPAPRTKPPELRVRLYCPVGRTDGDLKGEFLVLGDASAIPDDLESSVSFGDLRPVASHPEVTEFRVRSLMGRDFPRDRLLILHGTATFTVKSPSKPAFSLAANHEVWMLAERPAAAAPPVSEARPSLIVVPAVAGLTAAEAQTRLRSAGLRPRSVIMAAAPTPNRRFTAHGTRPLAGSQVARDSEVEIELFGDAGASLTAPDLRGLSIAEAEGRIAAGGFFVRREVLGAAGQGQPHLVVAGQSPPPGASIQRGDPITIRFHDQPAPASMPRLVGLTTEQAQTALRSAGLQPAWRRLGNAASAGQANRVGSQNPEPGAPVRPGSSVEVGYFDSFVAAILMPDVQGRVAEDARAQLAGLGLNVRLVRVGAPPSRDWAMRVRAQSPAANARVEPGSPVTIEFYGDNPALLTVPQLSGMTARDAEAALQRMGLQGEFRASGRARRSQESWVVVKQSPKAGTTVQPGARVRVEYLDEFRAPAIRTDQPPMDPLMPMLVGFRPAEVEGGLAMAGITVQWREIGPAPSPDQEWRIVRQSVAPFAAVPRGSMPVAEHYGAFRGGGGSGGGRGGGVTPPPPQQQAFPMPNVLQLNSSEAVNVLARHGLRPTMQYIGRAPSANLSDRVARTNPVPGAMVLPGAIVQVAVYEQYAAPAQPPPGPVRNPPLVNPPVSGSRGCPPPGGVRCPKLLSEAVAGGCLTSAPNGTLTATCSYNYMLGQDGGSLQLVVNAPSPQGGCGAVTRPEQVRNTQRFFATSASRRVYVLAESIGGVMMGMFREGALQLLREGEALTQVPCR